MWGGAALLKQLSMTAVPSTTPGEKKIASVTVDGPTTHRNSSQ